MAKDFEVVEGSVRVRVEGLARTSRQLSRAGADMQNMKALMHSLGMMVVRAAQPPVLTGRLAGTLRAGRGKTKAVVRAGTAGVPYAGVIHYGWPARGIRPNEFLTQALHRERSDIFRALDRGLAEIAKNADLAP